MEGSIPADPPSLLPHALRQWSSTYRWITIAGGFASFALALVSGANDIPTSFGGSIGAGVLSMRHSVILTFIMEIIGAALLGNRHMDAIESYVFKESPDRDLLMWGFMIAIIAATIWLLLATYMEMPVTSSLSIQGSIIGIALTTHGWDSIYWSKHDPGSILRIGGVVSILLSWLLAPLISFLAAIILFGYIKFVLLRSQESERRTLQTLPFLYGLTMMIIILFTIYKVAPGTNLSHMTFTKAAIISSTCAAFTIILASFIAVPFSCKRARCIEAWSRPRPLDTIVTMAKDDTKPPAEESNELSPEDLIKQFNELRVLHTVYEAEEEEAGEESPQAAVKCSPVCGPSRMPLRQMLAGTPNHFSFKRLRQPKKMTIWQRIQKFLRKIRELTFDHSINYSRRTILQHAVAEKFDNNVEELFNFLLVLTASVTALSHGSNNVDLIMGPYVGILNIFRNHGLGSKGVLHTWNINVWVRVMGAFGVSIGYAMWGWKLVRCLGGRLIFISPSRAFSAQICTLATVLVACRIHLPISTTHIFIGAILGVSVVDNAKNTNWHLVLYFILMWILTLAVTCGITAALYAFTIFSPSVSVGE